MRFVFSNSSSPLKTMVTALDFGAERALHKEHLENGNSVNIRSQLWFQHPILTLSKDFHTRPHCAHHTIRTHKICIILLKIAFYLHIPWLSLGNWRKGISTNTVPTYFVQDKLAISLASSLPSLKLLHFGVVHITSPIFKVAWIIVLINWQQLCTTCNPNAFVG